MKYTLSVIALLLLSFLPAPAQKPNDAVATQIKALKADKAITLTFDPKANSSKIMATADNFDSKESERSGIQAMN
ncbi:MAG: hypothetical protein ABIV21_09280, partial [Pyrinomonadaceae bacterium]